MCSLGRPGRGGQGEERNDSCVGEEEEEEEGGGVDSMAS